MKPVKRIFISDFPENLTEHDVKEKFDQFGCVDSVEIKKRNHLGPKNNSEYFCYVNVGIDDYSLQKCFSHFSNEKWKGHHVEVQLAKERFLDRLKREREETTPPEKVVKPKITTEPYLVQNGLSRKIDKNDYTSEVDTRDAEPTTVIGQKTENVYEDVTVKSNKFIVEPATVTGQVTENVYEDVTVKNNKFKVHINKIQNGFERSFVPQVPKRAKSKDSKQMEADRKRLQSMSAMKQGYLQKKDIIKAALSNIDNTRAKKINFDDSQNLSTKKKHVDTSRKSLFNDEDSEVEDVDFRLKNQFQGKKGEKLFQLQSKYNNDKRFHLDERFVEEEEEDNFSNEERGEHEKNQQLEILGKVLGEKLSIHSISSQPKATKKSMLRFDPNQPEHSKYELKEQPAVKGKKKRGESEKEQEQLPEVSNERFYKLSDSFGQMQDSESFSLLNTYGKSYEHDGGVNNEEPMIENFTTRTKNKLEENRNPFNYDSSTDDEADGASEKIKEESTNVSNKVVLGPSQLWIESLFFKEDDYRLQEGIDFITRLESEEQVNFSDIRRNLKQIVRAKVKNVERKNRPFKKKLGGNARKKILRVKKALKR